jgi:GR25 family glycosyltransferase involved in LPS biosynthesis
MILSQHIKYIYYINLDHRIDRKNNFLSWMLPLLKEDKEKKTLIRIPGIYNIEKGYIGCLKSHIKTIQTFLQTDEDKNICLIFEDDFIPIDKNTFISNINKIFENNIDFDIVMLSYNSSDEDLQSIPSYSFLKRCHYTYTSSGYLLHKKFAKKLLNNFEECLKNCIEEEEKTKRKTETFYLDVYWNKLIQDKENKWYFYYPKLGKQYENFSDVIKKVVDYEC